MDPLPKMGTPAMIENLTDHQWSWEEIFYFPLSILNLDSAYERYAFKIVLKISVD